MTARRDRRLGPVYAIFRGFPAAALAITGPLG